MGVPLNYILAATFLSVIQVSLGIALGLWIKRNDGETNGEDDDLKKAQQLAQNLAQMTSDLSEDVTRHRQELEQANGRLEKVQPREDQPLTSLVVGVVGEVLRANQSLQRRLATAEEELERQSAEIQSHVTKSLTDGLTGLPNRRAFDENLSKRLQGWHRHNVPFSLMLVDIDYFKQVNDQYGHVAGDQVLIKVAQTLAAALRGPDAIARFGGEEFAVLLPYTALDDAQHAALKALAAVAAAVTAFEGTDIGVTCSIGVASPGNGEAGIDLVKRADAALYASKEGGRNCGHVHNGVRCVRIGTAAINGEQYESAARPLLSAAQRPSPELDAALGDLRQCAEKLAQTAPSPNS